MRERWCSRWHLVLGCLVGVTVLLVGGALAGDDYWTTGGPGAANGLYTVKVDPTDSDRVYTAAFTPLFGDSLFYWSSDGGQTWANSWAGFGPARPYLLGPAAVAVHPAGPDTVYTLINMLSTSTVFMMSDDYGATWGLVPSVVDTFPFGENSLLGADLEVCPSDPLYMYAGITAGSLSPGWGMLRYTTDGGIHWNAPSDVIGLANPDSLPPLHCVAVDPSDELVAYAGLDSTLIKTTDGGDTWFVPNTSVMGYKDVTRIVVSPFDSDLVYAGGAGPFPVTDGGVYRSTDGGANWTQILYYDPPAVDTVQIFGLGVPPDVEDWVLAAARRKVFASANRGDHWVELSDSGFVHASQGLDVADGGKLWLASGNATNGYDVFDYTITDTCGPSFRNMWPWPDTTYPGPYDVRIFGADDACPYGYGIWTETVTLHWHWGHDPNGYHGTTGWTDIVMAQLDDTTFQATIPIQGDTGTISYYVSGMDHFLQEGVFPDGAPEDSVYWFSLYITGVTGGGDAEMPLPRILYLGQNSPNPVKGSTEISYAVPEGGRVGLRVYNITGELVSTLVDEEQSPNWYSVFWDGRNERGSNVASGVYFYRLTVPERSVTRKMIVMR